MSIIYAVIAKKQEDTVVILCQYDSAFGNYPTLTLEILRNMKVSSNISYKYSEQYKFHILNEEHVLYVCLAESSMKLKTVFAFLSEVQRKFSQKYTKEEIRMAVNFEFSMGFADTFKSLVLFFNSNREQDKRQVLKKEMTELKQIITENIEKVLQREEKVDIMVNRTANMNVVSSQIRENARNIKKQSLLAKYKCHFLIGGFISAVAIALFFII